MYLYAIQINTQESQSILGRLESARSGHLTDALYCNIKSPITYTCSRIIEVSDPGWMTLK